MRTDMPKMTVTVLTFNRREQLRQTLENILKQTFHSYEIIVIDNNSTDGTSQMVRKEFPSIKVVRMSQNLGSAGRNAGLKRASAKIIVTLDDDVHFSKTDTLEKINAKFQQSDADVVCFKVLDKDSLRILPNNWYHPKPLLESGEKEFETDYISEGAVAFRKEIFSKTGYYPEDFFLGHEGIDLALRIIDSGFRILYTPDIEVIHRHSMENRPKWRNPYYDTRNLVWLFARHYPLKAMLITFPYKLATCLIFCISKGQGLQYFSGLYAAFSGIRPQLASRKPLRPETMARLQEIRSERPKSWRKLHEFILKARARKRMEASQEKPVGK